MTRPRINYTREFKLAIVRSDITEKRLFEIAANNRGAFVKVFDNEEKAIQWLQSQ